MKKSDEILQEEFNQCNYQKGTSCLIFGKMKDCRECSCYDSYDSKEDEEDVKKEEEDLFLKK
ncbi:MAG: hypothetical protein LBQ04_02980 [Endomicrobium sp.]|jgi:hypothetical protein|nr:hypothetical protein [Endomicrobium sp.]